MARKRMIDPTIWADEDFGTLSSDAMILFIGIVSNADDKGRLPGNALFLASSILPYRGLTAKQAIVIRDEVLSRMKSCKLYIVDGKEYLQLENWSSYQSINKPSDSKYPPLPKDYRSPTVGLPPNRIEENRIEKKGIEENVIVENQRLLKVHERINEEKRTQLQRIVYFLEDTLDTRITNWGKQAKALKLMLAAGYTEEQITKTILYMAKQDEYFSDKGFDLSTVMNQIPLIKARAQKKHYGD